MSVVEVHQAPTEGRFEITVDGDLAGFAQYRDEGEQRVFPHTEIFERYERQGLGGRLVAETLAATRAEGLEIVPLCPFVQSYLERNPV